MINQYQNYIYRAQALAGLSEISPAKTTIDLKILEGLNNDISGSDTLTLNKVGLNKNKICSSISVSVTASNGLANINCMLKGGVKINGKTIQLTRTFSDAPDAYTGQWTCNTNLDETIKPKNCVSSLQN
ncbi:pilin [Azomonas agilis]|uniref:pilin n=1 Tax=Azomonas agilis TaxID=116849 RepID=UPI001FE78C68|nr:pilin [Azomonas agilis]